MRVIIAGSRVIHDYALVERAVMESGFVVSQVVCGCAKGVDALGERWAMENMVDVAYYPADWERFHKAAGPIRNRQMAENADALIAIYVEGSKGTTDMIRQANERGLPTYEMKVEG